MSTDWDAKLRAFLHDPPHKALCLAQRVGHEGEAERIARAAGLDGASFRPEADWIASAADRPRGLEGAAVDWTAVPEVARATGGRVDWLDAELRAALSGLDARALTEELAELAGRYRELAPRERFLAVWGLLPDELRRPGAGRPLAERLGPIWDVLPADTRVPDHSIWSHARMVSAFQGALPRPALLQLWVGPVQGFIASARRTRDLWGASWLLSYLVAKAAWWVSLEVGPDAVIFPDLRGHPFIDLWLRRHLGAGGDGGMSRGELWPHASLPNRLVVLLPQGEVERIGRGARAAIAQAWGSLVEALRDALPDGGARAGDADVHWRAVREGFPESAWAAILLPEDAGAEGLDELLERAREWAGAVDLVDELQRSLERGRYAPNLGVGYAAAYRLLQRAMEDRKAVASWDQWEGAGERCTVCGERPALPIAPPSASREQQRDAWAAYAHEVRRSAGSVWIDLDGAEMLCGLCLVRRALPEIVQRVEEVGWRGGKKPVFPSTGSVATAIWRRAVERLEDPDVRDAVARLAGAADRADARRELPLYETEGAELAGLDGRILLAGEDQLEREYGDAATGLAEAVRALRKAVQEASRKAAREGKSPPVAPGAPPTYYAILALDGDAMGRWLSGDPAHAVREADVVHRTLAGDPDATAPLGPSRHAGISQAVRDFAVWGVPAVIRQACGATVYAGGDDALAFLPIETVFEAARRLRVSFSLGGVGDGDAFAALPDEARGSERPARVHYWPGLGERLTASVGVAVAHHMTDLRTVVEAAREMLERAKGAGRDALGVAVLKRSGERREGVWPWFLRDGGVTSAEVLVDWRDAFRADLSPRILVDLDAERALAGLAREPVALRLGRLLDRHHGGDEGVRARLADGLMGIADAGVARGWDLPSAWDQARSLVAIAAFLARGGRE